jgi:hypothetical protein
MLSNHPIDWQDKLFELTRNPDLRAADVPALLVHMRDEMPLQAMATAFGVSKAAVVDKVKLCRRLLAKAEDG